MRLFVGLLSMFFNSYHDDESELNECVLDKSLKNVANGRLERLSDIKMQGKLKI